MSRSQDEHPDRPTGDRPGTAASDGLTVERGPLWELAVRLLSTRPLSFEEERKRVLFGSLALVAVAMLVVFGVYHLAAGPVREGVLDLTVAAALAVAVLMVRGSDDGAVIYKSAVILIAALFIYFGTLDDHGARAFWTLTLPAFTLFVTGARFGTVISLAVFGAWMLIFTLPTATTGAYEYSPEQATRFAAAYATILALALFMEVVRGKYSETMRRHQVSLERVNVDLKGLAMMDPLTRLPNRRSILAHLKDEAAKAGRNGLPMTVALLDVDHFKEINDAYGHAVGDAVLIECAQRVESTLRSYDRVGRYGGEEFLLVLSGARASGAERLLERVRETIAGMPFVVDDLVLEVTASIGVATSEDEVRDIELHIELADAALYRAKKRGRNQVRTYDEVGVEEE